MEQASESSFLRIQLFFNENDRDGTRESQNTGKILAMNCILAQPRQKRSRIAAVLSKCRGIAVKYNIEDSSIFVKCNNNLIVIDI